MPRAPSREFAKIDLLDGRIRPRESEARVEKETARIAACYLASVEGLMAWPVRLRASSDAMCVGDAPLVASGSSTRPSGAILAPDRARLLLRKSPSAGRSTPVTPWRAKVRLDPSRTDRVDGDLPVRGSSAMVRVEADHGVPCSKRRRRSPERRSGREPRLVDDPPPSGMKRRASRVTRNIAVRFVAIIASHAASSLRFPRPASARGSGVVDEHVDRAEVPRRRLEGRAIRGRDPSRRTRRPSPLRRPSRCRRAIRSHSPSDRAARSPVPPRRRSDGRSLRRFRAKRPVTKADFPLNRIVFEIIIRPCEELDRRISRHRRDRRVSSPAPSSPPSSAAAGQPGSHPRRLRQREAAPSPTDAAPKTPAQYLPSKDAAASPFAGERRDVRRSGVHRPRRHGRRRHRSRTPLDVRSLRPVPEGAGRTGRSRPTAGIST